MLAGTCLGNDARLAHLLCQQNLSDGVVDFVGTSVIQVLTLQVQLTAILLAHSLGKVQRTWSAHIVLQQGMILCFELLTLDNRQICLLQIMHTLVEYLRHVSASELSIETVFVYIIIHLATY